MADRVLECAQGSAVAFHGELPLPLAMALGPVCADRVRMDMVWDVLDTLLAAHLGAFIRDPRVLLGLDSASSASSAHLAAIT